MNLQKPSGLPLELDETNFQIKFLSPLKEVPVSVRMFDELKPVLMDPTAIPQRHEMYYMYRDIFLPNDKHLIKENNVRYDVTILPPSMLGNEFVKTAGHYHSIVPGTDYAFPEIYEVLAGEALFLIQKLNEDSNTLERVIAITASESDKVIYPPGYGHVIVNIGSKVLVTANWVSSLVKPDYESVAKKHGLGYYIIKDVNGGFEAVPNKNYDFLPEIKIIKANIGTIFSFKKDEPMYVSGVQHPQSLEFLNNPGKFTKVWSELIQ